MGSNRMRVHGNSTMGKSQSASNRRAKRNLETQFFSLSFFFSRRIGFVVEHRKTLTTILTWKTEKSDYALD